MSIRQLSAADWDSAVLGAAVPVLVDFWAPWCLPCRQITPIVEELAAERGEALSVVGLDIDANPGVASEYAVLSIPTLILFSGGQPVERIVGAKKRAAIERALEPHLA